MLETADFVTIDLSGPEMLGIDHFYNTNDLDNLIKKIYYDREREVGGLAVS